MAILSVFARFCAAALVLAVAPMLFGEMAHARTGGSAVAVVPQHSLIRDGARGRVVWPMAEASPSGPSKRPSASAACDGDGPIQACKTHPRNTGHLGVPASHNAYADRTSLLAYHHQQVGVRPTISLRSAHLHASTMDPRTNGDEDGLQFSHQLNDPGRDRCAGPGLHATRGALPGLRQVAAQWGASTYRHGGLMNGLEHIMYRHGPSSGFSNVSRFATGTRGKDVVGLVDDALRYGQVTSTGAGAYTIEYGVGRAIGTDVAGNAASSLRVFVRDGVIQTAFPF